MAVDEVTITINGEEVDVDEGSVVAGTFQATDIGDLKKMKADVTNSFLLADTARNHRIMKNANKIGSDSAIQLGTVKASVIARGLPLIANGRARIEGIKKGGYDINIYGGNYDFFEQIRDKRLRDLDWSEFDFTANAQHYEDNYYNNTGLVFPLVEYGKWTHHDFSVGSGKQFFINGQIPWMYLHTLIEKIFEYTGFNLQSIGGMLSLSDYKAAVICLVPPEGTALLREGADIQVDVAKWMPDVSVAAFIKSILFMWGAFMTSIDKTVYFIQFKELYENQGASRDWTDKFDASVDPKITFETGYAQNNYFKYQEPTEGGPTEFDTSSGFPPWSGGDDYEDVDMDTVNGEIVSDNKNLELEKTIVELGFVPNRIHLTVVQNFGTGTDVLEMWMPWLPGFDGSPTRWQPDFNLRIGIMADFEQKDSNGDVVTFDWKKWNEPTQNSVTAFSDDRIRTVYFPKWKLKNANALTSGSLHLTWDQLHLKYWNAIENSMLKNPTKVSAMFYLTARDIVEIKGIMKDGKHGRSVPVYVKQLNGHYYINKVSKFIPGRACQVELIRL